MHCQSILVLATVDCVISDGHVLNLVFCGIRDVLATTTAGKIPFFSVAAAFLF